MALSFLLAISIAMQSVTAPEAVAKTGGDAPGTGSPPETFESFGALGINNPGQVAFNAGITGSAFFDSGIWMEDAGGTLGLIVREGDPAPGAGLSTFSEIGSSGGRFAPNDAGQLAFFSPVGASHGIWLYTPGAAMVKVAMTGDSAPGAGASTFTSIKAAFGLTNAGEVVFFGTVTGSEDGIWARQAGGTLENLALEGGGGPMSTQYDQLVNGSSPTNPAAWGIDGYVVFEARLEVGVGGVVAGDDEVVVGGQIASGPSGLAFLLREGDSADGVAGSFADFEGAPSINAQGEVAVRAVTTAGTGIWKTTGTGNELVVLQGATIPGGGATFQQLGLPVINAQGRVAFFAELSGGSPYVESVWVEDPDAAGGLRLVALQGDAVPGVPSLTYNAFYVATNVIPLLSDAGQVAFLAQLSDFSNALVSENLDGTPQVIAREGDALTPPSSDVVDLVAWPANTNWNSTQVPINDFGELAYRMDLTSPNSTGVYVSRIEEGCTGVLCGSPGAISVTYGGDQDFTVDAGMGCGGEVYIILGSLTGTAGIPALGLTLPLTYDAYTAFTINNVNVPPLVKTLGLLDGSGVVSGAKLSIPPMTFASLLGQTAYHALAAFDLATGTGCVASDAVAVVFVP